MAFLESEILLAYQKQWLADASPVALAEKSRRVGLTWVEALAQVMAASSQKEAGGMNCYYQSYNKDITRDFIDICKDWAIHVGQAAEELEAQIFSDPSEPEKSFRIYGLRFASGFQIQALPSKIAAIRGKQGRICIDEAAYVEDLEGLIKAAMAMQMWGGKLRIISTHNGTDNYYNQLIQDARKGKNQYQLHRVDLDTALSAGLYQRICQTQGREWSLELETAWREELLNYYGEAAAEELFCQPQGTAGKYFSRHILDQCTIMQGQIARLKLDDSVLQESQESKHSRISEFFDAYIKPQLKKSTGRVYAGRDFARSVDLSCLWFFELSGDSLAHLVLIEMRNWPHSMQYRLICLCLDMLGYRFAAGAWDARGNGEGEAENLALNYGKIECVKATSQWYNENFPKLKGRFEDRKITIPADTYILDDFRNVEVKNGVPQIATKTKETTGQKAALRHGDTAIAAVLAEFAYQQDDSGYYPIEFEVVAASEWDANEDEEEDDKEWH